MRELKYQRVITGSDRLTGRRYGPVMTGIPKIIIFVAFILGLVILSSTRSVSVAPERSSYERLHDSTPSDITKQLGPDEIAAIAAAHSIMVHD